MESRKLNNQKQFGAFLIILLWSICSQAFGQSPIRSLEIQVIDRHSGELLQCSCMVQKTIRRNVIAETDSENSDSSGSDVSGKVIEVNPELFEVELNIMIEKNVKCQAPVTTSQRITKFAIATKLAKDKLISIDCGDNVICKLKIVDLKIAIPKY